MAKESGGALKLLSRSGQSLGAKWHFNEFSAERVFLVRAVLVIITLYICSPLGC